MAHREFTLDLHTDDCTGTLTIDGKKIELTGDFSDNLLKAMPIVSNPCARAPINQTYYVPGCKGDVVSMTEQGDYVDDDFYNTAMYYNQLDTAKQVALHTLLYRQLLKFAYDNNYLRKTPWIVDEPHYEIIFNHTTGDVAIDSCYTVEPFGNISFCSYDAAKQAIEKVVRPFMKEYSDFRW